MADNTQQIARVLQQLLRATRGKIRTRWIVLLLVLVGGYLLAEPALESRLGVDLPGVHSPAAVVVTEEAPPPHEKPALQKDSPHTETRPQSDAPAALADVLTETGPDTYRSEAGLVYGRGSIDGHRLKHLMSHAADEPNRPGAHGVFDETDPAKLVLLIDEVYLQALKGKNTTKQTEDGRTVYTVDLGRRVGYIGGESGSRRNHPPARQVRLVLDAKHFITAFPVRP